MKAIKRLIVLLAAVCVLGTSVWFLVSAAPTTISEGDFDFKVTSGKATLVKYWSSTNTSVTVPATVQGFSVVAIGEGAFSGSNVKDVTLSEGITLIEERAFYVCEKLTTVHISSTVQEIEAMAFANSFELSTIKLPKDLKAIDVTAFSNCIGLNALTIDAQNPLFSDQNGVLFNKNKTQLLLCPNYSRRTSYVVPDTVTVIGERAFYGCSYLESVTISDGVTEIKEEAFDGCSNLTDIIIGDGLEKIGPNAFQNEKIKNVRFYSTKIKEQFASTFNGAEIVCLCKSEHIFDNAYDTDCNKCDHNKHVEPPPTTPTGITSSVYKVSGEYISKIPLGTTAEKLVSGINEKDYIRVYKGTTRITGSTVIGTGMTVKLFDGNKVTKSVIITVTGDANGDGKVTVTDMITIKAHILKKSTLSGAYAVAADTNGDGSISITDFIQVKAKILGKGTITAR